MKRNSSGELGIDRRWMKDNRAVNVWGGSDWLKIGIAWQIHVNVMVSSKSKVDVRKPLPSN